MFSKQGNGSYWMDQQWSDEGKGVVIPSWQIKPSRFCLVDDV